MTDDIQLKKRKEVRFESGLIVSRS